jgi:hypothetical protein
MAKDELALTEGYGRAKRASMLYSATLALLSMARPSGNDVTWSNVSLPIQTAEWLALAAAGFYLTTFLLEWRIARWRNSKAVEDTTGANLKERFSNIQSEIGFVVKSVEGALHQAFPVAQNAVMGIEQQAEDVRAATANLEDVVAKISSLDNLTKRRLVSDIQSKSSQLLKDVRSWQTSLQRIEVAANKVNSIESSVQTAMRQLQEIDTAFNTLSAAFSREQWISFYILDLLAVVSLFFFAVIAFAWSVWIPNLHFWALLSFGLHSLLS